MTLYSRWNSREVLFDFPQLNDFTLRNFPCFVACENDSALFFFWLITMHHIYLKWRAEQVFLEHIHDTSQ